MVKTPALHIIAYSAWYHTNPYQISHWHNMYPGNKMHTYEWEVRFSKHMASNHYYFSCAVLVHNLNFAMIFFYNDSNNNCDVCYTTVSPMVVNNTLNYNINAMTILFTAHYKQCTTDAFKIPAVTMPRMSASYLCPWRDWHGSLPLITHTRGHFEGAETLMDSMVARCVHINNI